MKHQLDTISERLSDALTKLQECSFADGVPPEKTVAYAVGWTKSVLEDALVALGTLPRCAHRRRSR